MFLLVALSGFFSASETALFSLSRFQLRQIKVKAPKLFLKIQYLLDRPASFVATILIGNECANVLVSHFVASYYDQNFRDQILLITLINLLTVTPIIFIFGEITPKILAAKTNTALAPIIIPVFWAAYNLFFPLRWCIETIVNALSYSVRKNHPTESKHIREEDFLHLVEDIKNKGAIEKSEQELIENVFDLDDDNALELSTPLLEMLTIGQNESIQSAILKLKRSFAPRIPVLSSHNRVVGILYAKDLLKYIDREETEMTVKQLMKDPLTVNASMKAEALFRRFRQMKVHIAVLEDNQNRAVGIVTMEDILEQMFGELWEAEDSKI